MMIMTVAEFYLFQFAYEQGYSTQETMDLVESVTQMLVETKEKSENE